MQVKIKIMVKQSSLLEFVAKTHYGMRRRRTQLRFPHYSVDWRILKSFVEAILGQWGPLAVGALYPTIT